MKSIVREHYLRDDLSCGSPLCRSCAAVSVAASHVSCLSSSPNYFIPNVDVVIAQIDLLEHPA